MSDSKVQQILNGSRRINEMKEEIRQFISIMSGFIGLRQNSNIHERINVTKSRKINENSIDARSDVYWRIDGPEIIGTGTTIALFIDKDMVSERNAIRIPLILVEDVYRSLSELFRILVEIYPFLEEKVQPLLDAAKV